MRELVIVLSDLYFACDEADVRLRLPGLARMARFGASSALPRGWRSWLAGSLDGPSLAAASPATVASAAIRADVEAAESVWLADPVHLQAGLSTVHLAPRGLLRLDTPSQTQLASEFNRDFADTGFRLVPTRSGRFLAAGPAMSAAAPATDPARWLGSSLADALAPVGAPGALRRLYGEIETWLHEHPVNARRVRAGELAVSALWLWGGGPPFPASACRQSGRTAAGPGERTVARHPTAVFGDDPFVEGLAHVIGASWSPVAPGFGAVMAAAAAAQAERIVVHIELFREATGAATPEAGLKSPSPPQALAAFDRDWVEPALAQLDCGAVARVAVTANDRRVLLSSRDRWKRWRRRRPALAALSAP